ncbi:hypothetical protein SGPA1_12794 [Streptomyces misionensis JCM 4497]
MRAGRAERRGQGGVAARIDRDGVQRVAAVEEGHAQAAGGILGAGDGGGECHRASDGRRRGRRLHGGRGVRRRRRRGQADHGRQRGRRDESSLPAWVSTCHVTAPLCREPLFARDYPMECHFMTILLAYALDAVRGLPSRTRFTPSHGPDPHRLAEAREAADQMWGAETRV